MSSLDATRFIGALDVCETGLAKGWAFDRLPPHLPARVHVLIDNQEIDQILCNRPRPDVEEGLGLTGLPLGFEYEIPEQFFDGEPHRIGFRLSNRASLLAIDPDNAAERVDHLVFDGKIPVRYEAVLDGIKRGVLRGWALQSTRKTPRRGGVLLKITVDGAQIAQVRADRYRGDVAAALNCDPNCGYEVVLPTRLRSSAPRQFRAFILPDGKEVDGSPYVTSIANDLLETRLVDIADTIGRLQKELTQLRNDIHDIIPRPSHNLSGYDIWARHYQADLRSRLVKARLETPLTDEPLVSVLCPTYKPLMRDFEAAIESVIGQSYRNWELIIVDDGGKSPDVAARIKRYCEADPRIRALALAENQGISNATNVAMDAAQGKYTVFFDHDDLLLDVAIEVMVRAAERTGGKLLYSDEDKIDQAGYFLDPNLKPDFNYRYLLGCNYICHLTMIDTATMRAIGHLKTEYDGAQDHDFMLRAAERLKPSEIVHVPEILYHWRMTPNSTAVSIANKQYAVKAGVRAVADHLKRMKTRAKVEAINNMSIYRVVWKVTKQPSVTVIVPFKDQIETTRRCMRALLDNTDYSNFEILFVDNWSVTEEARDFIGEARKIPNVRVLTVEEPFNYSRLNNLAVAQSSSDFYMFMNNDVFVEDRNWLKYMVGEATAARDIAAVGAKLLYPAGIVQHSGVVVGPAGVAAHVHLGLSAEDYGYIGRARLTHEVSAVTAAAMLMRADVFHEVGGFDEKELQVAYNDVDLCLKIRSAGYRIVFCADAVAFHHESLSRGSDQTPENEWRFFDETQTIKNRWKDNAIFRQDPAYSRFFTVDRPQFFDLHAPSDLEPVPL